MDPHGPARRRSAWRGSTGDLDRRISADLLLVSPLRLTVLALSVAFGLTACSTSATAAPSPPANGITTDQAVMTTKPIAQSMSATPVTALSTKLGRCRDFLDCGQSAGGNRWIWVVVFDGTFRQAGGPAGSSPLPDHHTLMIIIDYRTGEFIQASAPGPYFPDY